MVYKGHLINDDNTAQTVAIKTVKSKSLSRNFTRTIL